MNNKISYYNRKWNKAQVYLSTTRGFKYALIVGAERRLTTVEIIMVEQLVEGSMSRPPWSPITRTSVFDKRRA